MNGEMLERTLTIGISACRRKLLVLCAVSLDFCRREYEDIFC